MLIEEFPESDLADDSLYNIGLCYYRMKQFGLAINTFQQVIHNYPDSTISVLGNKNESGMTAAKCYYSILLSHIAMGNKTLAMKVATQLGQFSDNTFVIINNEKKTYSELARIALEANKSN
jgi:tetratricopeptide (TPR) repeat protein